MIPILSCPNDTRRSITGVLLAALVLTLPPGRSHGAEPAAIRSVVAAGSGLQLNLISQWDRRYRVEASSDLTSWKTALISEPAEGTSLGIQVPMEARPAGFFKVTVFEWEELHAAWEEARQLWREKGLKTYQFEFLWNCHCPFTGWSRVQVQDGVVTRVVSVDTGEPLPREQWSTYLTVDGLFDWIEARRALRPVELRAEFDPTFGHPQSGYFDLSRQLADEEMGFQLRALTF